jgi:hypothetical protein
MILGFYTVCVILFYPAGERGFFLFFFLRKRLKEEIGG